MPASSEGGVTAAEARRLQVEQLELEAEGYRRRGLKDRVAAVEVAIKAAKGSPRDAKAAPKGEQVTREDAKPTAKRAAKKA